MAMYWKAECAAKKTRFYFNCFKKKLVKLNRTTYLLFSPPSGEIIRGWYVSVVYVVGFWQEKLKIMILSSELQSDNLLTMLNSFASKWCDSTFKQAAIILLYMQVIFFSCATCFLFSSEFIFSSNFLQVSLFPLVGIWGSRFAWE